MEADIVPRGAQIGYGSTVVATVAEDVCLERNKVTLLVGANGCGKSTFLRTLCGILPLLSGKVLVKRSVFLPDEIMFSQKMSVRLLMKSLFSDSAEVLKLAELLLVDIGQQCHALSKGNKQKVRVLIAEKFAKKVNASLLCLDEPLSGIDYETKSVLNKMWSKEIDTQFFSNAHRIVSGHTENAPHSDQTVVVALGTLSIR